MGRVDMAVLRPAFVAALALCTLCGCSGIKWAGRDGTIHHVILGFGVVSVPANNDKSSVVATRSETLGIHVSDQPGVRVAIGYTSSSTIAVPETTENIVVEVSQRPFGRLVVETNPIGEGGDNEKRSIE